MECPRCGSQFSIVGGEASTKTFHSKTCMLGYFELIERLCIGAFGSVWRAKDTKLDRIAAVKTPRKKQPDGKKWRICSSATLGRQLRYDAANIVGVHEVGNHRAN